MGYAVYPPVLVCFFSSQYKFKLKGCDLFINFFSGVNYFTTLEKNIRDFPKKESIRETPGNVTNHAQTYQFSGFKIY
jgi:hypothetical protein